MPQGMGHEPCRCDGRDGSEPVAVVTRMIGRDLTTSSFQGLRCVATLLAPPVDDEMMDVPANLQ
ncbi:hypothetical protein MPL1032_300021 [Mesorhizobium plurifarium]|uniref:Uncharacterized protein n=1 Tax=Mesorhizobium plurifarium TaxID=69974 RepID=A0A0K2W3N7_MESPL|nr:hypothetical protein MPL1032_300021 [Mesorhizobium plurifarium]